MRFRLIPSNDEFFALFNRAAGNLQVMVRGLRSLAEGGTDPAADRAAVRTGDEEGARITRAIALALDTTFVTPFDREDVHALAAGIDAAVGDVHHLSELLVLLPRRFDLPEFREQVATLDEMATALVAVFAGLSSMKGLRPHLDRIDELESVGDATYLRCLATLFSGEIDTLEVLKWKDLVEGAEDAMDRIEDVSDVVAAILVKHA